MKAEAFSSGQAVRLEGALLILRRTVNVGLDEAVEVQGRDGRRRLGRIVALDQEYVTIEVLEDTLGLNLAEARVFFREEPLQFWVGPEMLGRVFNGVGQVMDGGPPIAAHQAMNIDGLPINPLYRVPPHEFIGTGISAIDLMNSLVRGQKLPIFSAGGLPHDRLAVEVAINAQLPGAGEKGFAIVFAGIGVPHETAAYFRRQLAESGALARTALFLNLASDASTQRLLTPRFALTAAEYLAFHEGRHVLVIMTDMTNYADALREISASRGEIPTRRGYPGYLYSNLASLYERAGIIRDQPGSLTQLPILTMPSDDITHPVPDLTGYITEGQIVLSRRLDRRGIFPPIDVLASLSRLMKDGTGKGKTMPEQPHLANQLFASYARAIQARTLASVVGESGLSANDRRYLAFADQFETGLVNQQQARDLQTSMDIGWRLLRALPPADLTRLSDEEIKTFVTGPQHG